MRAVPSPVRKREHFSHSTTRAAVQHRLALYAEAFVANGGNGSAAAKAAGLRSHGNELLKRHPKLKKMIEERRAKALAEAEAKTGITVAEVLGDLKAAHDFDPRRYFNQDGTHKHPRELTLEDARQLEGWEVEEAFATKGKGKEKKLLWVRVVKVKIAKRITVRDQGMRHLGLFKKDNEQRTPGTPDELAAAIRTRLALMDKRTGGKA